MIEGQLGQVSAIFVAARTALKTELLVLIFYANKFNEFNNLSNFVVCRLGEARHPQVLMVSFCGAFHVFFALSRH